MLGRQRPRKSPVAPRRKAKEMSRSAYGGGEREVRSPLTVGICILGTATRWGKPLPCVGKAGNKDLLADTQARLEMEAGAGGWSPGPELGAPEPRSTGAAARTEHSAYFPPLYTAPSSPKQQAEPRITCSCFSWCQWTMAAWHSSGPHHVIRANHQNFGSSCRGGETNGTAFIPRPVFSTLTMSHADVEL